MNNQIFEDIRAALPDLSRSELKVAEWLLANTRIAIDTPITEVALATEVSEPTVIRFCRTMGLSGFKELKTHLIAALHKPQSYVHHDVSVEDNATGAAIKVLENSVHALVDLRGAIATMPFEPAVSKMSHARQLVFVGLGASGHVANDACHKFFRLGIPCSTATDSPTILQKAAIASTHDVFIAISHTGSWPELIRAMQTAKDRGAIILTVTSPGSELAQTATCAFNCHTPEDTNVYTPMSSRLAQLTLLDALQVSLAIKLGDLAETNLRLTKNALTQTKELET